MSDTTVRTPAPSAARAKALAVAVAALKSTLRTVIAGIEASGDSVTISDWVTEVGGERVSVQMLVEDVFLASGSFTNRRDIKTTQVVEWLQAKVKELPLFEYRPAKPRNPAEPVIYYMLKPNRFEAAREASKRLMAGEKLEVRYVGRQRRDTPTPDAPVNTNDVPF